MRHLALASALAAALVAAAAPLSAQQAGASGPYKVLRRANVGGEGGWDYIYAGPDGRLYIPRGESRAEPAANGMPATTAAPSRVMVYDLASLKEVGMIPTADGHGVAIDPKTGNGFLSSDKVTMFNSKTLKVTKEIDVGSARPDGIIFDGYKERVYVFSHPTRNATVIDAKTGSVVGTIDLGGVPEEGVADGHGMLYDIMQDAEGSVAVVDVNAMKTLKHYPLGGPGRCNGLALDDAHHVLFAACAASGPMVQGEPPKAVMVILSATDGKILDRIPLPGGSDGAVFNPATQEAFATLGNGFLAVVKENSPTSFTLEQTLETMNGARTITLDASTNRIYTMSFKRGPAPAQPAGGERGGRFRFGRPVPGSFTILEIGK
ncbi:MAG: YncE family protein [Gemmatimonadota bacterium]|nr:YncE family protein [Gemmatimonadota bacterium]